ncbi:DNA gyrase inhibitor YacG [Solemya pervernicosa gill symbiont]|uniref:DNA gyrase inhibitor YacG n=2 Tax=Gammaproteobacteria incertae sedis TaxID=118884 RepID=A0A1T2L9P5_9GAMM|nr:DNA gyrase inhibitor YacG [Candidatus Reidiella endopervernicosa]OOZ41838.1 DNA gyrase inhibitor YacG [Solemya pervernicosa gill symbiont]QKQ26212.1 DNA gyrase inhibitor YacG [Candidatus Reidiella endopervernicosa]
MSKPLTVSCPTCGKAVDFTPKSTWRPFCSERCRLIDLGEWFAEEHNIPGDELPPRHPDDDEPSGY